MIFDNNTAYQIYRILVSVFGTLGMTIAVTPLKENKKRNLLLWLGYAVYVIVFTLFFIRFWGFLSFLRSAVLTISVPGVVMNYLIADISLSRQVFNCLSQLLFSLYLIVSTTWIHTFLGGTVLSGAVLLLLAYLAMIFLEFLFLRNPFLTIAETIAKGWGILALIPSSFFILAMAVLLCPAHYTQNRSSILLFYLLGVVILTIYYAIFQYLWTQYKEQTEKQKQEILKLQIQSEKRYADDIRQKSEEIRRVWQDTHDMLSGIARLAEEGNVRAILRYTAEASATDSLAAPARYCADSMLNATLAAYLGRAKSAGIALKLHLSFPQTLPVDSAELCICFANALENAITACEKLPKDQRKIIVKCIHNPAFMFEIANSCSGQIPFGRNGLPLASRDGHGIGTRSIMAFCEKHHAFYSFSAENGWFRLIVTL